MAPPRDLGRLRSSGGESAFWHPSPGYVPDERQDGVAHPALVAAEVDRVEPPGARWDDHQVFVRRRGEAAQLASLPERNVSVGPDGDVEGRHPQAGSGSEGPDRPERALDPLPPNRGRRDADHAVDGRIDLG